MPEPFEHLLSPIKIGPKTIKNRVLVTAHVPGVEKGGLVNDAYVAYQRARARGGAGLQISGSSAVHETGSVGTGRALNNANPDIVETYKQLADGIHAEGGHFLIQLGHAAATVNDQDVGRPLIAPSPVQSQLARETPQVMTRSMIARIVEAHYVAATRVRDGGLDGVEILAAFGFLVGAFMSPLTNKRDDEYGGALENRLRFAFEVIDAVRQGAGDSLIVGMRLPGDERVEGGLTQTDMKEIAQKLSEHGRLDYLNVIVGTNYSRIQRMEHWPPTPAPHGLWVSHAAAIKKQVTIPVFTTGRITDPRMAEDILKRGDADMVGMTRAQIADPDLVAKMQNGRLEDIRPCIGANVCISMATEGKPIRCIYNPEAGREHDWGVQRDCENSKRVAVIGGGPAGLEAARVAAMRGHQVTLYETQKVLGGQLRLWSGAPLTAEFRKSVSWYETQLTKLQVQIRRETRLQPDDIAKLDVDAIIMATGSRPAMPDKITGQENSPIKVMSPWEVMESPPEKQHVVLVDEGGGRGGLSAVDAILDNNRITIISTEFAIGELINPNVRTPLYKRFLGSGVTFLPCEDLIRMEENCLVTRNLYSNEETRISDVDVLINWRGNQTVSDLQEAIEACGIQMSAIGDCRAPRQVHIATAEGAMAARRL